MISTQQSPITISTDLALALDPALMLERMGMQTDPWQADMLRSNDPRALLNCHRQSGKSTVAGALAAHTGVYQPNSLVLLLSPSLRQSGELFKKTLDAYHTIAGAVPPDAETRLTLELSNGSRIISLPGKEGTIRGYSGVRLLIVDEASRVPDELYMSIRPMLAVSGGRLIGLSTPFGKRGWFYEAWESSQEWERYRVPVTECPRISTTFLQEERAALGLWYGQEYLCEFIATAGAVFDYQSIEAMLDPGLQPLFPLYTLGGGEEL